MPSGLCCCSDLLLPCPAMDTSFPVSLGSNSSSLALPLSSASDRPLASCFLRFLKNWSLWHRTGTHSLFFFFTVRWRPSLRVSLRTSCGTPFCLYYTALLTTSWSLKGPVKVAHPAPVGVQTSPLAPLTRHHAQATISLKTAARGLKPKELGWACKPSPRTARLQRALKKQYQARN